MLLLSRRTPRVEDKFYNKPPTIGVVIGTYGSVAYIELQLAAIKKFNPGIPVLIHDDASSRLNELVKVANHYRASLHYSTFKTSSGALGDLCAFVQGLLWARNLDLDILVKISRRWVTMKPWTERLQNLAIKTQFPTYSGFCERHQFGFRTEATAMAVLPWTTSGFLADALDVVRQKKKIDKLIEAYVHEWAQKVIDNTCDYNKRLLSLLPVDLPFGGCMRGYGIWADMFSTPRNKSAPNQLWHETHSRQDYARAARSLGLSLKEEEFLLD